MTSAVKPNFTVECPDIFELKSRNDPNNYEREVSTNESGNDLTHSHDETTSSIASGSTVDSTVDSLNHSTDCNYSKFQ